MSSFRDDRAVVARILAHIESGTTDASDGVWREPVANYRSPERLRAELEVLRRHPRPLCPAAAVPEAGRFVTLRADGRSIVVVRGADGIVRGFLNACRHRGNEIVAVLSRHTGMIVLEPIDVQSTRVINYVLAHGAIDGEADRAAAERDVSFVNQTGGAEDLAVARAIQRSLASGANEVFTFGRHEGAIAHFHRELDAALAAL